MNFPKWVDSEKGMNLVHFCLRASTALTLESVVEKYRKTAKQEYMNSMSERDAMKKAKQDIKQWVNAKT